MWFCAIYALGALIGIGAVAAGLGSAWMGGMPVTREDWLEIAAPLIGMIAILMVLTTAGLRRHRVWARWSFMLIWPLIVVYAVAHASLGAIPWWLATKAIIDATGVGLFAAWLLFWQRGSLLYFYRIRQAGGGMTVRR